MMTRLGSWWQKIKQHPVVAMLVFVGSVLGIALIVVLVLGYRLNWHWTGLVSETSEPKQHAKTLWDWLNLLGVLAIPVVVALGAAWYTAQQGKVSDRANTDNQRETALQAYIDKMSELLLHEKLRDSAEEDEVRKIARIRTLTILPRLDANRKRSAIQFLYEAGLIDKDKRIIELNGINLVRANLVGTTFVGAYLEKAYLTEANLTRAHFAEADLREAHLWKAILTRAHFAGATLEKAYLGRAVLSETHLEGAVLCEADLEGAYLGGANLEKALQLHLFAGRVLSRQFGADSEVTKW